MRSIPLNRGFYSLGTFIATVVVIQSVVATLLYARIGGQIYSLPSYRWWFIFSGLVVILWELINLQYFLSKQYRVAFAVMVLALIVLIGFFATVSTLLITGGMREYYIPSYLANVAAGVLLGVALIFSKAGEKRWLRIAGIAAAVDGLVVAYAFIMALRTQDFALRQMLETVLMWAVTVGNLTTVLFIMNFRDEQKALPRGNFHEPPQRTWDMFVTVTRTVAVIGTLFLGLKLGGDSFSKSPPSTEVTQRARQLAEPFEARFFVNAQGDTLRYRLMQPLGYDPQKKYPLVVCLHHGGAHGTDNIRQVEGSPPALLLASEVNRKQYPAFLFLPHCPQGAGFGGIVGYPALDSLVFEGIAALEKEFAIDETRRYVTGISGGGYGSWHFICARPKMFAAAIPICGGTDADLAGRIVAVPVWAFHGEDDRAVPVRLSRDMIEAMKGAGGNPKYTEFAGAGHDIWRQVSNTPGLVEWMFEQRRN